MKSLKNRCNWVNTPAKSPEWRLGAFNIFILKVITTEEDRYYNKNLNIKLWQEENEYLNRKHKPEIVVERLLKIYLTIIKASKNPFLEK